jgi:hypothetical protein
MRPNQIVNHPKRKEIDAAIVAGKSQKSIADEFGFTQVVVWRYIRGEFARHAQVADMARQVSAGTFIVDTMLRMLDTVEKMRLALVDDLTDPEDPEKFDLSPRANEIKVIYYEMKEENGKERKVKRRELLKDILQEMRDSGRDVEKVIINTTDIRKLLLDTVDTATRQLKLWVDTEVAASQVKTDQAVREILDEFIPLLIEESDRRPEVKEHVTRTLRALKKRLTGTD